LLQKSFFKKFYFKNKNFKKSTSIFRIPNTSSRPGTFATAKKYATKIANIFTNFYINIASIYRYTDTIIWIYIAYTQETLSSKHVCTDQKTCD